MLSSDEKSPTVRTASPGPAPAPAGPTWKTSLAHFRHRLCWQGRITTGLENISRQMGQMSCFSRLSMLCASPSSGLKPTAKFIPSVIVLTLARTWPLLAASGPLLVHSVCGFFCSLLTPPLDLALRSLLCLPLTICRVLSCFQTLVPPLCSVRQPRTGCFL